MKYCVTHRHWRPSVSADNGAAPRLTIKDNGAAPWMTIKDNGAAHWMTIQVKVTCGCRHDDVSLNVRKAR